MKHYFKKLPFFLYICLALIAYSCSEEKNIVKEQSRISTVNLSDLPFLQKELSKDKRKGSCSKEDAVYYLDKINTQNIIQIIDQLGIKSYTFALNYREQDTLFNLCAKETNDGYSYTLMKYTTPILDQWIQDIKTTKRSDIVPEVKVEPLDNKIYYMGQGVCISIHLTCPELIHSCSFGSDCHPCLHALSEWSLVIDIGPCAANTGGGTSAPPVTPMPTPTGSNTGSGPSNSGANTATAPNVSDGGGNKTPCDALKDLFDPRKGNIKNILTQVNDNSVGYNGEQGAIFTHIGNQYSNNMLLPSVNSNGYSYSIGIPTSFNIYGAVHTHPVNGNPPAAPIFSYGDLQVLLTLYRRTNPDNQSDVVFLLQIPNGDTYAIKIDDYTVFSGYVNGYESINSVIKKDDQIKKDAEKNLIFDYRTSNGAQPGNDNYESKYLRGFLDELKGHGASLYKKYSNGITNNNWKKLEPPVNQSSPLILETPCNQ